MYAILFYLLVCLSTCHCLNEKDEETEDHCVLLTQVLDNSAVLMEIRKTGFHRELETTVELSMDVPSGVRVLLVHRWPRNVFVDPFQLASLSEHSNWQILLDSAIDLEEPAHKTSGFVTYVYPAPDAPTTPRLFKVTVPFHGRYHEPSFVGETFTSVKIIPPELLLRTEKCLQPSSSESHAVVDAPCTPDNSSTCQWVKLQHQQEHSPVVFQLPVGDGSLVMPVCAGSLLVTVICCVALSKYTWKHQII